MSRSYLVLVGALVGVVGLAGMVRVLDSGANAQPANAAPPPADEAEMSAAPAADITAAAPDSDPVEVPIDEPFDVPIDDLIDVPIDEPFDVPIDDLIDVSIGVPGGDVVARSDATDSELADRVRGELGLAPIVAIDPDCELSVRLTLADRHREVACLESQLIDAGVLTDVSPDQFFDAATEAAVRSFQDQSGLVVDGVVGPQTAGELGSWVGAHELPPDPDTCAATGRSAVVDRFNRRAWLCEHGEITEVMPITTAISQPDPGEYEVYAKELNASSDIGGDYSEMTHFVAFTYGKYQGARIAFHSVPTSRNGDYLQPLDSVGTAELQGESAGCIRLLPGDAELIWSWLEVGDTVIVVT